MQNGLTHLVEHRAIELDLPPFDLEIDLFPERARGVAHHAWKALEYLPHGNHAARHDLVLESSQDLGGTERRLEQRLVSDLLGDLRDAVARDHELTDDVHQGVQ